MAIQAIHQPIYRYNFYGLKTPTFGGIERPLYKETASQTFAAGDLLYMDANGTIAICTTSSDALNVPILGQATKAATGTTGAVVHFRPIIAGDVYLMNVFHTTSASAVVAQTTFTDLDTARTARRGLWMKAGAYSTTAAPLTTNTGTASQWAVDMITAGESATTAQAYGKIINAPQRLPDGTANAITDVHCNVEFMFHAYSPEIGVPDSVVIRRCLYFSG